ARETIASDAAAYVVGLLSAPAELCVDDVWRPIRPGDIAILCRSRYEVDLVRAALSVRNVPSVTGRTGNVLLSEAADAWLALLAAFEYASPRRVRAVALTAFFGWTAAQLSAATDDDLLPLFETIAEWADTLAAEGVAGLWTTIEQTSGVTRRTLGTEGGERLLTDLGHITEMIHTAHRAGALSLHGWLLSAVQQAAEHEDDDEERARRLETDSDAVQVLTAHASKGLEFGVVLCPFLWNKSPAPSNPPVFHPAGSDRRFIEVGGHGSPRHDEATELAATESAAEEMRLLYVALTRARHHTAVWWACVDGTETTPLTRFLFRRNGDTIDDNVKLVSDERLWGYLDRRVTPAGGVIAHRLLTDRPDETRWDPPTPTPPTLESARFGRPIDTDWTRTSFSGLTAESRHAAHVDTPASVKTDEPEPIDVEEPVTISPELPMASLPGGAAFGSLVHAVFEDVDLAADDRADRILEACRLRVASAGSTADPEVLASALLAVAETPLFAEPTSTRLADIGRKDQLVEMIFDLPVSPEGPTVPVAGMAELVERHLPTDHPLRPYADRLRALSRTRFRGFLTGAIDATVRIGDPARFWIMDYKTNRLGDPSRTLTIDDYRPAALDEAMIHGDYVLQSLLYQVALHRYLGVRLPDYRPDTHLGGSLYLFVRGMTG
ncbi:MAG: 3'-5' exonuclease, partial [Acidimicrobiia bacterium]